MKTQTLAAICAQIDVWEDWRKNYGTFVPRFIEEAAKGGNWSDWDEDVFYEYFLRTSNQCVSSLSQGYFNHNERDAIKEHWGEIAPLLQKIAQQQQEPQYDVYQELKAVIRKYTDNDKRAATNRMIAGLQPQLLCTIVNQDMLGGLFDRLSNHVEGFNLEWKPTWFENSHQILQLFKQALNTDNGYEVITYPWQVYKEYEFANSNKTPDNDMSENTTAAIIDLLKYKKQIILQGPPGTGKTKLAKEIAEILTGAPTKEALTKDDIIANCTQPADITAAKTQLKYKVLGVNDSGVRVENSEGKEYTALFSEIVRMYEQRAWEKEGLIINGTHSYSAAVAKYLYAKLGAPATTAAGSYKIIQFHPSYTYEDFVRGIVAKPNAGGGITYEAENKVLAKFAEEALSNFQNSERNQEAVSKEFWTKEQYQNFRDHLEAQLEESGEITIKENTLPKITAIEDDAVRVNRYSNENDSVLVKDSDIVNGYVGLHLTSPQVKIKDNSLLTKSARSGMYYLYQNLVERFKSFLEERNLSFVSGQNIQQQELKNYVLIIDEINRANLSSVLGELIYALEYRGNSVESIYKADGNRSEKLILPPNLYIIGTMNTADRSVGHIDYAIRRRFAFVDVLPELLEEDKDIYFNTDGYNKVAALFTRNNVSNEFEVEDVQVGHSYFIVEKKDVKPELERDELFKLKMKYEVLPILYEYVKDGVLIGAFDGKDIKKYISELNT